jgi:hypothetical protein
MQCPSLMSFGFDIPPTPKVEVKEEIKQPEKISYEVKGDKGDYYIKPSGIYIIDICGNEELICPTFIKVTNVSRINGVVEVTISYGYKNPVEIKKDLGFLHKIKEVRTLSEEFKVIYGMTKYVQDVLVSIVWEKVKQLNEESLQGKSCSS